MDEAMKLTKAVMVLCSFLPLSLFAASSFYCPQNHGYIKIGMSQQQVISACGQPLSKKQSDIPVTQKVPVTQLIYNNKGTDTAFYGYWNIPVGSGGARIEIDIVKNKIAAIRVNGANSNSFSVCEGSNLQVGDPAGNAYAACGSPSITNNTFINQVIPGDNKIEIWSYQSSQFQSPVGLTFVNGKLQSID